MQTKTRLLLGLVAGVVTYLSVMYLFDGNSMDWKKGLVQSIVVMTIVIGALLFFRRKNDQG
jgi:hypothetical protein